MCLKTCKLNLYSGQGIPEMLHEQKWDFQKRRHVTSYLTPTAYANIRFIWPLTKLTGHLDMHTTRIFTSLLIVIVYLSNFLCKMCIHSHHHLDRFRIYRTSIRCISSSLLFIRTCQSFQYLPTFKMLFWFNDIWI